MKIAVLLMCHKSTEMVNLLLESLSDPRITVFVHPDKKMDKDGILQQSNVVFLDDNLRVNVIWAQISMVDATLNLIDFAKSYGEFDYFWLCSGQDFPIKSIDYVINYLEKNSDKDFIRFVPSRNNGVAKNEYDKRNEIKFPLWMIERKSLAKKIIKRFYVEITGGKKHTFKIFKRKNSTGLKFFFGATWWCLRKDTVTWMTSYLQNHPEYYDYFYVCLCPDESFFHTLYMNSPYSDNRADYLHYVDWSEGKNSPKVLTINDYDKIVTSDFLMARKFEYPESKDILEELKNFISK